MATLFLFWEGVVFLCGYKVLCAVTKKMKDERAKINFVMPHHTHDIDLQVFLTYTAWDEWHLPLGNTTLQVQTWQQRK